MDDQLCVRPRGKGFDSVHQDRSATVNSNGLYGLVKWWSLEGEQRSEQVW